MYRRSAITALETRSLRFHIGGKGPDRLNRYRSRESGPYADKEAQRTAETSGVVLSWLAGEAA